MFSICWELLYWQLLNHSFWQSLLWLKTGVKFIHGIVGEKVCSFIFRAGDSCYKWGVFLHHGDTEGSKPGADLHPLSSICVVGAVQTRDSGGRCVSRWWKQTCRGSDTELCGQTSFVSLAGSMLLQMCLLPVLQHSQCVSSDFLRHVCILHALKNLVLNLLENCPHLESCHWLLFLVVSQVTFYLTPPALPAYTSSPLFQSGPFPKAQQDLIWSSLQLPSFIWWFVFTPWKLCSHLILSYVRMWRLVWSNNIFVSLFLWCPKRFWFHWKWGGWWAIKSIYLTDSAGLVIVLECFSSMVS